MKRFVAIMIILILLCTIIVPFVISKILKNTLRDDMGLNYIGEDNLCSIFEQNKQVFEESVDVLSKLEIQNSEYCMYDDLFAIHNLRGEYTIERKFKLFDTPFVKKLDHVLLLTKHSNAEVDVTDIDEINNSSIYRIIKDFDFKKIIVGNKYILFVNMDSPFVAAILYTKSELPDSLYRCETKKLADNWYYCIAE